MSFLDCFSDSDYSIRQMARDILDRIECGEGKNGTYTCSLWNKDRTRKLGTHEGTTLEEAKRKAIKQDVAISLHRDNQKIAIEKKAGTIIVAGEVLPFSEYEAELELEKLEATEE